MLCCCVIHFCYVNDSVKSLHLWTPLCSVCLLTRDVGIAMLVLVSARFHRQAGTKIQILENLTTGSIQEVTVQALREDNLYDTRNLHCNTDDTGYGGTRRFRGWLLVSIIPDSKIPNIP